MLAEDHYLDFLIKISAERDRIPDYIRGVLASSALMFVGFSLADWEFRVIMRGLVAPITQRLKIKHVAVQVEQVEETRAETVRAFLEDYFKDADSSGDGRIPAGDSLPGAARMVAVGAVDHHRDHQRHRSLSDADS